MKYKITHNQLALGASESSGKCTNRLAMGSVVNIADYYTPRKQSCGDI